MESKWYKSEGTVERCWTLEVFLARFLAGMGFWIFFFFFFLDVPQIST